MDDKQNNAFDVVAEYDEHWDMAVKINSPFLQKDTYTKQSQTLPESFRVRHVSKFGSICDFHIITPKSHRGVDGMWIFTLCKSIETRHVSTNVRL